MRAIIQRVTSASVTVENEVISKIGQGFMVLVGIATDDTETDAQQIAKKILTLRLFSDPTSSTNSTMWKKNIKDIDGEILCVSQFTLCANTSKGNKPDFHRAMGGEQSRQMYSSFLELLGRSYDAGKIKDGEFGAMMDVSLTNEGPVTIILDSKKDDNASRVASRSDTPAPSSEASTPKN